MRVLSLLLLVLFIQAGCQEETSKDVKSSKSSASSKKNKDKFSEGEDVNYFKLVNTTAKHLSHHLHPIGQSNGNDECKLTSSDKFTTSDPEDIDCYMDVEELDLYFNGANFTIATSAKLCEYVAYVPFSFYQFLPGNSSRTVNVVVCPAACAGIAACTASSPSVACTYDYSQATVPGPNCDTGTVTVNTTTYTYDATANSCSSTVDTSETECGGEVFNCIGGPRKDQLPSEDSSYVIWETGKKAFNEELTVDSPYEKGYLTNKYIANFTRMCGGPANNTVNAGYTGLYSYDGDDIDTYANGYTAGAVGGLVQYAEDPFQGAYRTSAYYQFYCLDQAYDVKARIRLMIRDFDKEFATTSTSVELVSDISTNGLMDSAGQAGDFNWFDDWNDRDDWDDHFLGTGADRMNSTCTGFGTDKYTTNAFPQWGL